MTAITSNPDPSVWGAVSIRGQARHLLNCAYPRKIRPGYVVPVAFARCDGRELILFSDSDAPGHAMTVLAMPPCTVCTGKER